MTDRTLTAVDVTMWGEMAEKYNEEMLGDNCVLALKCCRVSDFGGKSLNTTYGSHAFVNPDRPEAHQLRTWYDNQGRDAQVESISKNRGGGSGNDPRKTLRAIKDERLGFNPEKPDYFVVKGTVTFFKHDMEKPPWYTACPSADCNKKVQPLDNGSWQCEKCDKQYPAPVNRYILSLMCCDASGSQWLTAFNEVAEVLLGCKADDLNVMKESGDTRGFDDVFANANFKSYLFKCRAKAETREDETRVRCHIISATPINYKAESKLLLDEIAKYG